MKSIRAQLLVTLAATAVAAGVCLYKRLPPGMDTFRAVDYSDHTQVRRRIRWGVDIEMQDEHGFRILHDAAGRGEEEIVQLLVSAGANVNAKILRGDTPLGLAVANDHRQIAALLRRHGARE